MSELSRAMDFALRAAEHSPDPNTQVGAILVEHGIPIPATAACNTFPRGVEARLTDEKLIYIEHAERNAIYAAARRGISTRGLTMVCTWGVCAECARAIAQAGIATLVRPAGGRFDGWAVSLRHGDAILAEAGVKVVELC